MAVGPSDKSGTPLVLLHGFTGAASSWDAVIAALPSDLPAYALTLPGHAGVPEPGCADFAAACHGLAAQVRRLTAEPAHLIGYSLGGRLALGMAQLTAMPIACLSFIGTHTGLADAGERQARVDADARWQQVLRTVGIEAFAAAWEQQPILAVAPHVPRARLAQQASVRRRHDAAALAACLEATGLGQMPDFAPGLPTLGVPSQWLAGNHDEKFLRIAQAAAARAPQAAWHAIAPCGHNPLLEAPHLLAAQLVMFHRQAAPAS
jgi:2-succinyl-6-hydroxy-2,4-cyclohexadiene-1-carboxylate synthase